MPFPDGRSAPSPIDLTASLDEEDWPFDEDDTSPGVDLRLIEAFEVEMENTADYRTSVDEERLSADAGAHHSGEVEATSSSPLRGDEASSSANIPCPPPISSVAGEGASAPETKKTYRRKQRKGVPQGHSQLDLSNLYIIRPEGFLGEYHVAQLYVGPYGRVRAPKPTDHVLSPPLGYFGIYPMSFAMGLQFPLHPFIKEYLDMVSLPPALLTPNSYSLIVGFLIRCEELGFSPTTALFTNLYRIGRGSHQNCAGYAALHQVPKRRMFTDLPSSIHVWKAKFVFVNLGRGGFFPSVGHSGLFELHNPPWNAEISRQVEAFIKGGPRSITTYITEYKMAALGFVRYYCPGDVDDGFWPKMEGSYEQADGPSLGVPAEAEGFEMDCMSFMARAAKKADAELKAAQAAEEAKKSASGSQSGAEAVKKPVAKKKSKRAVDEGQKTLAEAGLNVVQAPKKTKKNDGAGAPSAPIAEAASAKTLPLVDLDEGPSSAMIAAASRVVPSTAAAARLEEALAKGTYEVTVRYPVKGGLFNETVSGDDVLAQAMPEYDRQYLSRQGKHVHLYDGGLDYVVQGALMLREQHWRQEAEIERLRKVEAKAVSADEALQDLRDKAKAAEDEMKLLQCQLNDAEAARKKADEAAAAAVNRAAEAERLKAEAERAAEKAVADFTVEGWKAEDQIPFCYKVVAERLTDWVTKDPAGEDFWMNETQAFYNCGQYRMQRLIYRKLRRRFRKMRPRVLSLPRGMKNLDEDMKLPRWRGSLRSLVRTRGSILERQRRLSTQRPSGLQGR
ncbi:unnamed protein product [Cuscuta epithymum]|uniref:Transposase (putative) gypsy type domain-containing protein n=1 Tax=Cuscuta epithymum TaxID=186058 RepID=A0AAV0FDH6_9ASTE|nr:unnamed protein product [Cuscuta epithymum]